MPYVAKPVREDVDAYSAVWPLDMSSVRRYKKVVLSSGLVKRSAICSFVGTQLMPIMSFRGLRDVQPRTVNS